MATAATKKLLFTMAGMILLTPASIWAGIVSWDGGGDGNSWQDPANWDPDGVPTADDDVTIDVLSEITIVHSIGDHGVNSLISAESISMNGGTLEITGDCTVQGAYTHNGGILKGTGDVFLEGPFHWNGGTIEGNTGAEVINAAGGMQLGGAGLMALKRRTLEFDDVADWTNGFIFFQNGAVIVVGATDTFNAQGVAIQGVGTINNAGDFIVNGAVTVSNSSFVNTGSIDVQGGMLNFTGNSSHTAAGIAVAAGAFLDFSNGTHNFDVDSILEASDVEFSGATVNLAGTYTLSGSSTTISSGTANFTGSITGGAVGALEINGGTINFSNIEGLVTADSFTLGSGLLTGSSDVVVTGMSTWNGGATIRGITGTENFTADGGIEIIGGNVRGLDGRILEFEGLASWLDGTIVFSNGAVIDIDSGDVFNAQANNNQLTGHGTIINAGDFIVNTGDTININSAFLGFVNTGTVDLLPGTINLTGSPYTQTAGITLLNGGTLATDTALTFQGGSLHGEGIIGRVLNTGADVEAGFSIGVIDVQDEFVQDAGTLVIELAGISPGEYDVIAVDGDANLGGVLTMDPIGNFEPQPGDAFTVLTASGSINGNFDVMDCMTYYAIYETSSVTLVVRGGPCPADINCDGQVNVSDLLDLIAAWGPCSDGPQPCPADVDDSGDVTVLDLLAVISDWGACP